VGVRENALAEGEKWRTIKVQVPGYSFYLSVSPGLTDRDAMQLAEQIGTEKGAWDWDKRTFDRAAPSDPHRRMR